MKFKFCIGLAVMLSGMALCSGDSYSELMDRAEKLTAQRYDKSSRAFKIKSEELDEILDSEDSREEKIRKLKSFIQELENQMGMKPQTEPTKAAPTPHPDDPLKAAIAAAENGDPEALFQLGMIYWNGKQTMRSVSTAVRWFRRAADEKHVPARFMMAYALLHGKGMVPDPKKAFAEFKKLYEEGFAPAGLPLGRLYYEGGATGKNYAAAAECLKKGLNAPAPIPPGFQPAILLGRIYFHGGYGLQPDPVQAAAYLKQAGNDPEANLLLGCLFRDGKGVPKDLQSAVKCFRFAMEHGCRQAGGPLGKMYYQGLGVKKDDREAIRCLTPAAEEENLDAALLLASILSDEKSPAKDQKKAFYYYRIAARKGSHEAACRCGIMLMTGTGVDRDPASALEYLSTAARLGNVLAAFLCGGLERDAKHLKKAAEYYRMAADKGHPEAIRCFASMALAGQGIKADPVLGIRYLNKLADRNDIPALLQLGGLYETGIGPVAADIKQAIRYYHLAADRGNAEAQAKLGILYFSLGKRDLAEKYAELAAKQKNRDGLLILQKLHAARGNGNNDAKAQQYLRELADSGDPASIRQYGIQLYRAGRFPEAENYLGRLTDPKDTEITFIRGDIACQRTDGKADFQLAKQLLEHAADAGHTGAMVRLGQMYQRGDGVRQDFRQALRCFMRAANKKDPEGMYLTGTMYYNGEGVSADYTEAYRWFLQAAENGNILAMQYLSIMFKEGIGVPKNNIEAAKWRRKAIEQPR